MLRFDDWPYQLTSFKGVGNVWGYNTIQGKTSITQSDRIGMSSEDQQHHNHDWHAPNGKIKTAPDEHWLHQRILMLTLILLHIQADHAWRCQLLDSCTGRTRCQKKLSPTLYDYLESAVVFDGTMACHPSATHAFLKDCDFSGFKMPSVWNR